MSLITIKAGAKGGAFAGEDGTYPATLVSIEGPKTITPKGGDPFDLDRFVEAQADDYATALAEVRGGRKRSHWMWFVFPQLAGLGFSSAAQLYGIKSRAESEAYLRHPVLGPRLVECCEAALGVEGRSAEAIFGHTDAMKLRSCATLFESVSPPGSVFGRVVEKFFRGTRDDRTLAILGRNSDERET